MSTIKKGNEFNYGESCYIVNDDYTDNMIGEGLTCTVVESEDEDIPVGSSRTFSLSEVHNYILNLLSINTNNDD